MADKYGLAVDISMLIISSLLVFSAASNEKIYDAGATFKTDSEGKLNKTGMMLGMSAETVNKFNMLVSILGAAAVGAYGLSLVYKKTESAKPKGPGIYTAVFGFSVSIGLILSGVITCGLYAEVDTFKEGKKKSSKVYRDASYFMISVGSVALLLITIMVSRKKKPGPFRLPRFSGGNGVSTFFTYK